MQELFIINDVYKIYSEKKSTEVRAINGINLQIKRGEFTALIGPSGSGKSTLLNLMSGLEKPTRGSIYLVGKNLSTMSENKLADFRRDHLGFVFQSFNLIPVLTVAENIEYIMLLQNLSKSERNERVRQILHEVQLEGFENKFPRTLSGGQQQRVAIARAMVAKPDIILADEPTANLDSRNGYALLDMMANLNEKYKVTFIFSTHDSKIMERAHRLITIADGKIENDTEN